MKLDGKKILALRNERCWSQEQLAVAAGLSARTIQRIEKDKGGSLESMKALASVFETDTLSLHRNKEQTVVRHELLIRLSWMIAFLIAVVLLGSWVIDILIPTLKGADFDNQYEINGNFRYLDFACISFAIGVTVLCLSTLQRFFETTPWVFKVGKTPKVSESSR